MYRSYCSSVSIATELEAGRSGDRILVGRDFPPIQTAPEAHPASCTMGIGSFPGVKSRRDMTLTPHSLLVPWSRKGRAIPLLPLWAVQPVQSLSACTRVHCTFFLLPGAGQLWLWYQVNLFIDWMDPQACIILYFLFGKNSIYFLMLEITVSQCFCYIRYITIITPM